MNDTKLLIDTSKFLSFVLRHEPQAIGLAIMIEVREQIAGLGQRRDGGRTRRWRGLAERTKHYREEAGENQSAAKEGHEIKTKRG